MKPVFKIDEVVVADTYSRGTGVDLGRAQTQICEVLYIGEKTKNYKVGNKVLLDPSRGKELVFEDQKLLIFREDYIFCEVVD